MIVIDELKALLSIFIKIFKTFLLIFYYIFERMMENYGEIKIVINSVVEKMKDVYNEIINLFKIWIGLVLVLI